MNILCVCTGNICRSPMMEFLLKQELPKHGITDAEVRSAGVHTMDDEPASAHAITVMQELGIDIADHRSRQLNRDIASWADVAVVLSPEHGVAMAFYYGFPPEKVLTVGNGIEDPYGRDLKSYRACRDQLIKDLPALIEALKAV